MNDGSRENNVCYTIYRNYIGNSFGGNYLKINEKMLMKK
jgi:hypothetical protein